MTDFATVYRCCRDHMTLLCLCVSLCLSHLYSLPFPSRHLSQQGVVSVETTNSQFSTQRNCYHGNLTKCIWPRLSFFFKMKIILQLLIIKLELSVLGG